MGCENSEWLLALCTLGGGLKCHLSISGTTVEDVYLPSVPITAAPEERSLDAGKWARLTEMLCRSTQNTADQPRSVSRPTCQQVQNSARGQSKSRKEPTMATLARPVQPAPSPLLEIIEPLLSVPQAAKILGISQCTLRNWIQRKKIARVKVGGRVMFRPDTIREFIAYNTRPASG
jgi:excisionase family DNA binding protein